MLNELNMLFFWQLFSELLILAYWNEGPIPERPISINPGLKFCSMFVFYKIFLCTAYGNILCFPVVFKRLKSIL